MKYLDGYRDPGLAGAFLEQLRGLLTRPWSVMEVCGSQAHNLTRVSIDQRLPYGLSLVHGPGCPVCVAPVAVVDLACRIAGRPGSLVCVSSEDVLHASGSFGNLAEARDRGADVRLVYSPLGALSLARKEPCKEVVFVAVGFETTAPTSAAAVLEAERLGLTNFSMVAAHLRAASGVEAALEGPGSEVQAVLAPGHVAAVTGLHDYEALAQRHRVPIVVTGPEPVDLLEGLARAVRQLEDGTYLVENQYARGVRAAGNPQALAAIATVFESTDATWRGLGNLKDSALRLAERFRAFDASARYPAGGATVSGTETGPCGDVLTGRIRPTECSAFGTRCVPEHPLGLSMLSAEGACSAYYRHQRRTEVEPTSALSNSGGLRVF